MGNNKKYDVYVATNDGKRNLLGTAAYPINKGDVLVDKSRKRYKVCAYACGIAVVDEMGEGE